MQILFIIIAVLIAAVMPCRAQSVANISIIHHNIHSGGQAEAAAEHIVDLLETTPQKALLLLNEANYARQHFSLPYPGWSHIWRAFSHEARGNPIFVRDAAATMMASWVLQMEESWTHNQPKNPRVYSIVKCELVNAHGSSFTV